MSWFFYATIFFVSTTQRFVWLEILITRNTTYGMVAFELMRNNILKLDEYISVFPVLQLYHTMQKMVCIFAAGLFITSKQKPRSYWEEEPYIISSYRWKMPGVEPRTLAFCSCSPPNLVQLYPLVIFSDYVEYIWNGRRTSARFIYFWTLFTLYKFVGEFYL